MRKFKLKLLTLISALILSCSCFLFALQEGVEVKAEQIEGTNSAYIISDSFQGKSEVTMLIAGNTEDEIKAHYYIYNSAGTSWFNKIYEKEYKDNRLFQRSSLSTKATFQTQVAVDENNAPLRMAINNGVIQVVLSVTTGSNVSSTQYMKLGDKTTDLTSGGATFSTEPQTMTSYTYAIEFCAKSSTGEAYTYLDIKKPTIILSTTDNIAPTASLTADMENLEWSGEESRDISFKVEDQESGIQKVLVYDNYGKEITPTRKGIDESSKNATYSFTAEYGKSYYVKAWDNVNNVSNTMPLIGADDLKLDTTSGLLTIAQIDTLHSSNLNVNFRYSSDERSAETLYYKIVNETDFYSNEIVGVLSYDGTISGELLGEECVIPFGNIIKNPIDNTNYVLCAVVIDAVGNKSEVATQIFKYDSRRYVVEVTLDGGILDGSIVGTEIKAEEFGEELPHAWAGTKVKFGYTPNEGYEFYEIRRFELAKDEYGNLMVDSDGNFIRVGEGQVLTASTIATGYTYTCDNNYSFEVKFRYVVLLTPKQTEFTYSVDDEGNGKAIVIGFTLNDKFVEGCVGTNADAIDPSIIELSYILNGKAVGSIKDAGAYTINWSILSGNIDFVGGGSFGVIVNPKAVQVEYLNFDGLVYNGQNQSIGVLFAGDGLNDAEKNKLVLDTKYYLSSDIDAFEPVNLKNAGEYFAKVTLDNLNYLIENDRSQNFAISKKTISVTYNKVEFDYTASVQAVEYALSENIAVSVVYYLGKDVVDGEGSTEEFKNAGEYTFVILPQDTQNYIIGDSRTNAKINKVNVYFSLTKTIYTYTGKIFGLTDLEFSTKNGETEDSTVVNVNGLRFDACNESNEKVDIQDHIVYNVTFKTDDNNYNLYFKTDDDTYVNTGEYTYAIVVETTKIYITIVAEYEYTGKAIDFIYVVKNQNGEALEVAGLKYTINGIENFEIKAVGTYSYAFTTNDPAFEFKEGSTGTFEVVQSQVTVTMEAMDYTYSSSGVYNVKFSAKTARGIDLTDKVALSFEKELLEVGEYPFDIVLRSADDMDGINIVSILDVLGEPIENKIIVINPMEVQYEITKNYTYDFGNRISVLYVRLTQADLNEGDVVVDIEEIVNAGNYFGTISSKNKNYVIVVDGCQTSQGKTTFEIVVAKYKISVLGASEESATYVYPYTGSVISPQINLSYDFDDFEILDENGETLSIINVGEYVLTLGTQNSNIEFVGDATLRVTPRAVEIEVDTSSLTQTYGRNVKQISYKVKDIETNNTINVESKLKYFAMGDATKREVYPYLVGNYGFEIEVDGNYVGSLSSDDETYLTITKKKVTLNVAPNQVKVYGESDDVFEYVLSGVCYGDSLTVSLSRQAGENVGRYEIILDSNDFENYVISYEKAYYQIAPKKIAIVAQSCQKVYGDDDPEYAYKIIMNGAFVTSLLGNDNLEGRLEREAGENVGSYEISLGTLNNNNYDIIYTGNYLEITPKEILVSINDTTVTYGESGELSYEIDEDYCEFVTGELEREAGESVGNYAITLGSLTLGSNNYQLVCENEGTYRILPRQITVVAMSQTKVYGDTEETLEYLPIGLIGSDTLSGALSREIGEDVGVYKIDIGSLDNENYFINFVPSTMVITKAGISIVVDNKSQIYGNKPLELTYSVSGLKNNDTLSVSLKKTGGNDAGIYDILAQFNLSNNYYLENYTTGTYTITKANIDVNLIPKTVSYTGQSIEIVAENFEFPLRYIYTKFGESVDEIREVGSYKVKAIFDGNNNYNSAESVEVSVNVVAQQIYITLVKTEFVYDGETKYPEYSYDRTSGLTSHQFEFDFGEDVVPLEEGRYPFTLKVKDGLNYAGSVCGEVVIKKAFVLENKDSVVECTEATFDESAKNIELKQEIRNEKFNNEKIVSVCTLKNSTNVETNGYIYTIKVKATSDVESVKLYKVGLSGYTEVAIKIEDGYFVFNVDNFESEYIITTEVKKLSTIGYIAFAVCGVLVLGLALLVVRVVVHPRKNRLAKVVDCVTLEKNSVKSKSIKSSKIEKTSKKTKSKKRSIIDDFHII